MTDDPDPDGNWMVPTARPNIRIPRFRLAAMPRPELVAGVALELFLEKGYRATRIQDVATRAKISKRGVYHYFHSKAALLDMIVEHAVADATAGLSQTDEISDDPAEVFRFILAGAVNVLTNQTVHRLIRLQDQGGSGFQPALDSVRRAIVNRFGGAIDKAAAAIGPRGDVTADQALGMIVGPLLLSAMSFVAATDRRGDLERLAGAQLEFWTSRVIGQPIPARG